VARKIGREIVMGGGKGGDQAEPLRWLPGPTRDSTKETKPKVTAPRVGNHGSKRGLRGVWGGQTLEKRALDGCRYGGFEGSNGDGGSGLPKT